MLADSLYIANIWSTFSMLLLEELEACPQEI